MATGLLDSLLAKAKLVNTTLLLLSAAAITGMSFMIVVDVILRYVFNSPLPASVEISQLLEPYVVFLPFAYTLAVKRHVRVTLLTTLLPTLPQRLCDAFAYLVDFVFFVIICYYSWLEAYHSFVIKEIMFAAIRLPWWVGKLGMTLGMFFMCTQCLLQFFDGLKLLKEPS